MCWCRYQRRQSSQGQQGKVKDSEGEETAAENASFYSTVCLICLQGISDAQSMRASKENHGESI